MIQKIAAQIRSLIGRRRPETAIILGSGLGALADEITDSVSISYADIDGFPQSTVQGHGGKLIIGRLEDKEILCMQGRFHLYEGHKPQVINTVIKAFQLLGIKKFNRHQCRRFAQSRICSGFADADKGSYQFQRHKSSDRPQR